MRPRRVSKEDDVPARKKPTVTINPLFKLLLWVNSLLCTASLAVMIWAALDDPMSKGKERLFNACEHVFTLTAGAFIGLLGGRAAAPDQVRDGNADGQPVPPTTEGRPPRRR